MERLGRLWKLARRYPSVVASLTMILALLVLSAYAILFVPLQTAVDMWDDSPVVSTEMPRAVPPVWTNLFRRHNLPQTIIVPIRDEDVIREAQTETRSLEVGEWLLDYDFQTFPSEIIVFQDVRMGSKMVALTVNWIRPDGTVFEIFRGNPTTGETRFELDPVEALGVIDADPEAPIAQHGTYALRMEALTFEPGAFSVDGQVILYGAVHGIAGTDVFRRDLAVGLLWGTPIALMFGFLAAIGATLLGFVIAAVSTWYGGWVDGLIQRLTEINMMVPFLPTIIVVARFYSKSIWIILAFVVAFSILTSRLKTYRAMFKQLINAPYIEAAKAYGASNWRLIFRYMIPRAFPVLLPHIILGVPMFVFLEASLAYLGVSDPALPTWGKILNEARLSLYMAKYYWILEPIALLMFTGMSFSMLGYTLDRVFNPRLRAR